MRSIHALLLLLASLPQAFAQSAQPVLMRNPALSSTHIVFEFAGDLWNVPRSGGEATRLTSGIGNESSPVFSPDGTLVAFAGEYDGNTDVFTVPTSGGVPKRITHHPAAISPLLLLPTASRSCFAPSGIAARLATGCLRLRWMAPSLRRFHWYTLTAAPTRPTVSGSLTCRWACRELGASIAAGRPRESM